MLVFLFKHNFPLSPQKHYLWQDLCKNVKTPNPINRNDTSYIINLTLLSSHCLSTHLSIAPLFPHLWIHRFCPPPHLLCELFHGGSIQIIINTGRRGALTTTCCEFCLKISHARSSCALSQHLVKGAKKEKKIAESVGLWSHGNSILQEQRHPQFFIPCP